MDKTTERMRSGRTQEMANGFVTGMEKGISVL